MSRILELAAQLEALEEEISAEWGDIYRNSGAELATGPILAEVSGMRLVEVFAAAVVFEWRLRWSVEPSWDYVDTKTGKVVTSYSRAAILSIPEDEWQAAADACERKDQMAGFFEVRTQTIANWFEARGDPKPWTQTQSHKPKWSKETP